MKPDTSSLVATAALAFASVLSGTLLIPVVRPIMHWVAPGNESATHAFMAFNLLGGVVAAPIIARIARRATSPATLVAAMALADGALLLLIASGLPLSAMLIVRTIQGALNIGVLSTLMGATRSGVAAKRGARYGLLGMAMMLGVALGAPLGTACLSLGLSVPILASAALNLAVALSVRLARLEPQSEPNSALVAKVTLWRPALWVFAERFSVGLFVVTFALHVRACLGTSDARNGLLLTAFLVPFALAVYPAGRIADRLEGRSFAALGLCVYGVGFLLLRVATESQLLLLMPTLGLASAVIFASAMREVASVDNSQSRVVAMSILNSAGNLGMLLGTAIAGIVSATLRAHGGSLHSAHALVFGIGGAVPLGIASLTLGALVIAQRGARSVRLRS